ncbi:MAG: right-handed parallel beta-helix repeat-containing protein, partial [Planctomycetota bacterium]
GILIRNNASGNRVFGNVIGFYDDPGLGVIGAANGDGIRITGAAGNLIGTPDEVQPDFMPSRSNLIVGNKGNGIQIVTSTGASLANANRVRNNFVSGNKVGVAVSSSKFAVLGGIDGKSSNVIVNQTGAGVAVTGSTNVQIVGNLIGLFDTATAAGNGSDGISITASSQQVEISSGNRISANKGNGVAIGTGSSGVTVTGNTIGGTLDDGTSAGNAIDGVAITSSIGNTVGAANKVSNNGRHGISISDARATALAAGNRIFGSQIFANTANGVLVAGGSASTIGGTTPTNANFIYSNGGDGIKLDRSNLTGAPTGYAIQGNYIGTNTNRDVTALGNAGSGIVISQGVGNVISDGNVAMNNSGSGIELLGGSANVVGSGAAGKGNTITNNAGSGIRIAGISANVPAAGHVIAGNTISANGASGVAVSDANVSGITIGQKVTAAGVAGLGNTISLNTRYAVEVAGKAQQIGIQGNSMFANSLGGIFLAAGANRSAAQTLTLTSAVIRSTTGGGQSLTIAGSLQNALFPNQQYSVEIYANAPADGNYSKANVNLTGYQQRRLLGTATVTADAKGNATFTFTLTTRVAVGEVITATATSLRLEPGSTSNQSSKNVTANLPGIQTPRF